MQNQHRIPDLDFQHIQTFLALSRFGNFSQTGLQVGMSQSAVSRHIRALEESLGLKLFERLGRKAILTSAGHTLRARLEKLMREAESLPRVIKDLAEGVQGDVRIGASITAANSILPPLLGAYRRKYPGVELALQPASSPRVLEMMMRGEVDLAIVTSQTVPAVASVLAQISDEILIVAPGEHPVPSRRLKIADLGKYDFIQREAASDTRALVSRWFQSEGVQPKSIMEVG